jgi:branched-chain amino acid transport system substrate-binding protein
LSSARTRAEKPQQPGISFGRDNLWMGALKVFSMAANLKCSLKKLAALAAAFVVAGIFTAAHGQQAESPPSSYTSIGAATYSGPERAPTFDLRGPVVLIGLLVPLQGPEKADGEAIVRAARMALNEVSRRAPRGGQRLELAIGDESGPSWGQTTSALLHLVSEDQALAVITSANGPATHLSEQVGNKIGVPILTLSTDPTTTEIDLPWIFRVGPSDSSLARTIAEDIERDPGLRNMVLVAESNHDGRMGAREFQREAQRAGALPFTCTFIDPLQPDYDSLVAEFESHPAGAIVLWVRPGAAGNLVERLRKAQIHSPIYLSPQAAQESSSLNLRPADIALEPDPPEGAVWTMASRGPIAPARKMFEDSYEQQTGRFPSPVAAEAYDAVMLIAEAFRAAGPNRARVRDWVAKARNIPGVSGDISFDQQGNNTGSLRLVRLRVDGDSPGISPPRP